MKDLILQPLPADKARFYELDLLRFVAALVVVVFHYSYNGHLGGKVPVAYPALASVTRYGFLGVPLFFMISGFVISVSAAGKTPRQFVISRIVRLYPAYWVACTLTFLVLYLVPSTLAKPNLYQYAINLTMGQGFLAVANIDGVYWTLIYELKFYIIIYILLLCNKFKYIGYFAVIWLAFSALYLIGIRSKYLSWFIFPGFAPLFIAGILFYVVRKNGLGFFSGLYLLFSYLVSMLVYIPQQAVLVYVQRNNPGYIPVNPYSAIVVGVIITLFYLIFLVISLRKTSWNGNKWIGRLGSITYPLYLLHAHIGYVIYQKLAGTVNKEALLVSMVVFFVLFAYAFHRLIEKPGAALLHRLLKKQQTV